MKKKFYVNSCLLVLIGLFLFSSCGLLPGTIKGACEAKFSAPSGGTLYFCANGTDGYCETYITSMDYTETHFFAGDDCSDLGYDGRTTTQGWIYNSAGSEYPGDDGYFSSDSSSSSPSYCTSSYEGPTSDIQRDSYCQAAYTYLCVGGYSATSTEVTSQCDIYNSASWGYTGDCQYCP